MYYFESDSLIIYVSRRNRQTAPLSFIFDNITSTSGPACPSSGRPSKPRTLAQPTAKAHARSRLTCVSI